MPANSTSVNARRTWVDFRGVVWKVPTMSGRLKYTTNASHMALRIHVFHRDNFTCQICKVAAERPDSFDGHEAVWVFSFGQRHLLVVDHKLSRRNGGSNHPDNLQTLCEHCNTQKVGLVDIHAGTPSPSKLHDYKSDAPKFRIVKKTFWRDWPRQLDREALVVALYIRTCPTANAIGLYRVPPPLIGHCVGLDVDRTVKALRMLCEKGFCKWDEDSDFVFIPTMAAEEIGESIPEKNHRHTRIARDLYEVRNSPFAKDFCALYGKAFSIPAELIAEINAISEAKGP